jgi:hypothetical protein
MNYWSKSSKFYGKIELKNLHLELNVMVQACNLSYSQGED